MLTGVFIICGLAIVCSWSVTIRANDQRVYYQDKYEDMLVKKNKEILDLKYELNKAEVFDDWKLLWEYALPEIKRSDMEREAVKAAYLLSIWIKGEEEKQ